ncbi:quinone oxidoreductase family protein [Phenylobacterium immobile]|uniref:quinone oxidoreductase family protein n=1 Tax=Phenylobacterium immobile TaxID=21 RepID=UPI000B2006AA|nr:quinone oxidoreductase [Phenylobacterium immobile]
MRAVRITKTGGPEVLAVTDVDTPKPAAGEILLRHEAIGLNFIDTYQRSGLYPIPLPSGLGTEAAGVVAAVGPGVTRFAVGERAAYVTRTLGAYAELSTVSANEAVKLPAGIDSRIAAAALLKGLTAEALLRRTHNVGPNDRVLIHAAAGGVGQIMVQWAKRLGAEVIATVGSEAKADQARKLGADHVILYRDADVAAAVMKITGGKGVTVAYDSVGKDTFEGTLGSLATRGLFVSYGNASGPPPPMLSSQFARGSFFFTRPSVYHYIATPEELDTSAAALFDVIGTGVVSVEVGQTYPLEDVRLAHEAMASRTTLGASLLIP